MSITFNLNIPHNCSCSSERNETQPRDRKAHCYRKVLVNERVVEAYVDLNSERVTLRRSDAFLLNVADTRVGCNAKLRVDMAEARINVAIVPDAEQDVPLIVGQSFLEAPNVACMLTTDYLRFYDARLVDQVLSLGNLFNQVQPNVRWSSSLKIRNREVPEVQPERTFKYADLSIRLAEAHQLQPKPNVSELTFGKYFTDHMLKIFYYEALGGWQMPEITPFENLVLHPAAKVLHYAVELFEGMKAYRGVDGKIRVFRPEMNMDRMNTSAARSGLPTFNGVELINCINKLISIDEEWVPHSEASSLYIRPTLIGIDPCLGVAASESAMLYVILSPVGSYFKGKNTDQGVSLLADPRYTRAWPGGCGDRKMGSNYAPTIHVQKEATEKGLQQVLWLYGEDHQLTEAGTMNVFLYCINDEGEKELITPPLNGLILPGITRNSILSLAREWNQFRVSERKITMTEICQLLTENRLLELFGAGTACIVSPISEILYVDQNLYLPTLDQPEPIHRVFYKHLSEIQYGYVDHPWAIPIR